MSCQRHDDELMDYLDDLLTTEPVVAVTAEVEAPQVIAESSIAPQSMAPLAPAASPLSSEKSTQDVASLPARFDCLLFRVGPFKLALPLLGISSVHTHARLLHTIPGMAQWILGIVQTPRERLCVVDLPTLFAGGAAASEEPIQRLIVLYGSRWAIACHEILEVRKQDSAKVRWRRIIPGSARAWCVGTLADDLCILLEPRQLHRHLDGLLRTSADDRRAI